MADATYQDKVYRKQGGEELVVASGGAITIETGGTITYNGDDLIAEIAALSGLDSTELGYLNGVTAGAVTASKAIVVGVSSEIGSLGTVTLADAANIVANTTTGTKIGTAVGQKLGFWNATPIVQPSGAAQAAPAAYSTGAFGLDSDVNMQAFYDLVVAMRTALVNAGIMKGAA